MFYKRFRIIENLGINGFYLVLWYNKFTRLRKRNHKMSTKNSAPQLEKHVIELEDENKRLHETIAYLTRKLYGCSSEKTSG